MLNGQRLVRAARAAERTICMLPPCRTCDGKALQVSSSCDAETWPSPLYPIIHHIVAGKVAVSCAGSHSCVATTVCTPAARCTAANPEPYNP